MYRKPYFPRAEMMAFTRWSQQAEFVHADFRAAMAQAEPGDVVYCDPPNLPLTTIDGLVTSETDGFTIQDHKLHKLCNMVSAIMPFFIIETS